MRVERERTRIGAVVLAAGASRRFGPGCKLLADVGGEPLIRRVTREVAQSGVHEAVVVTGSEPAGCRRALEGLPVRIAHNADWADGMGGSIATGVRALSPDLDGAFIVPADLPFLTAGLLRRLAAEFRRAGLDTIVFPATPDGAQRNPVLWPRRLFLELAALRGPGGAKRLLHGELRNATPVPIGDPAAVTDIDTLADLETARAHLRHLADRAC